MAHRHAAPARLTVTVAVARRLPDPVLRGAVITLGVTVAVVLLAR